MKRILFTLLSAAALCAGASIPVNPATQLRSDVQSVKLYGYVGSRIDTCIARRVMTQDALSLVEPFKLRNEGDRWQSEFWGKWMLGACAAYQYNHSPELLAKITECAKALIGTADSDGYIGNYKDADRLKAWDIWGMKYVTLGLLAYYSVSHDKAALKAAENEIDNLIATLKARGADIADCGNYFGMAACSVLEPVVYLYNVTRDRKYLDFAESIAASIEKEGHAQLVGKALEGVPVSRRSHYPDEWWSYNNGMKAYEMMSCYEGLIELSKVTENSRLLEAAIRTAESIIRDEINIAGSGAAFECWYEGKKMQTVPAYHTMETCVTFTWMQLCARLLDITGLPAYADEFERTMYNALFASMRADGGQIAKYSPLEGHRSEGEHQCGLPINCCNANGPRGFALIPQVAYVADSHDNNINVNLYIPSSADVKLGKNMVKLTTDTDYPLSGDVTISVDPSKAADFALSLRIPSWIDSDATVTVNGRKISAAPGSYCTLNRRWTKGDVVTLHMPVSTRLVTTGDVNKFQAVTRGPLVFARDSRYADGDVDETSVIVSDENGRIDAKPVPSTFSWLTIEVPMVLGTDLEDAAHSRPKAIRLCDFSSAGNDWDRNGRYRVWLPQTLNQMHAPYHKY